MGIGTYTPTCKETCPRTVSQQLLVTMTMLCAGWPPVYTLSSVVLPCPAGSSRHRLSFLKGHTFTALAVGLLSLSRSSCVLRLSLLHYPACS